MHFFWSLQSERSACATLICGVIVGVRVLGLCVCARCAAEFIVTENGGRRGIVDEFEQASVAVDGACSSRCFPNDMQECSMLLHSSSGGERALMWMRCCAQGTSRMARRQDLWTCPRRSWATSQSWQRCLAHPGVALGEAARRQQAGQGLVKRAGDPDDDGVGLPHVQILSELSPFQRERAALQMLQPGYTRKVLDMFRVRLRSSAACIHCPPWLSIQQRQWHELCV